MTNYFKITKIAKAVDAIEYFNIIPFDKVIAIHKYQSGGYNIQYGSHEDDFVCTKDFKQLDRYIRWLEYR